MKRIAAGIALLVLFFTYASADYNSLEIPDSAEIRRTVIDTWLDSPVSALRDYKEEIRENKVGESFQIRMEEDENEFSVIIAPQTELNVDLVNGGTHRLVKASVYPKTSAGSWILYKEKKTGNPVRIEWYFNPDSDVFLQFRPQGRKAFADMIVFGSYAARSVPLGIPFERLYTADFQDIRNWTEKTLPWSRVTVVPGQYADSVFMAGVIKSDLDSIIFVDDGCYDEKGKPVSILTGKDFVLNGPDGSVLPPDEKKHYLSGAGFLKWIIDGIVEPATGRGTKVQNLTEPTVEFDSVGKIGVMSQEWNLMFTLDWCRNLASEVYSVRVGRKVDFKSAGLDVTGNYFASDIVGGTLVNSSGYIKNTGYAADRLKSLLYVLAVTEPSWFYLAAIRQGSSAKPDELVFNNCAVFFPYFDEGGKFGCFVFEQGKEISLDNFMEKYKGSYVHLERVKSLEAFFPYEKK